MSNMNIFAAENIYGQCGNDQELIKAVNELFLSEYSSITGESAESIANTVLKDFFLSKRFVRCDICKKWMEVTDNRKSKTTHVNCSKNLYWRERKRAVKLWQQGKTIEEIVNEINEAKEDSSKKRKPDQIKGWIEKEKANGQ